ncbi:MAG TPA: RagB/SusD family nutrient uptake outer membrane protein [Gemmatimonadaceae bacterium]|nr:RagB/SusD family nutrient uptake outer membrane protein [Gemmatimonadaceae bacterium]
MTRRRFWHGARLGLLLTGFAACSVDKLTIPNYNQPTTEGVSKDSKGVQLLATGVLAGVRNNMAGTNRDFGVFGREVYNYFSTDGRTISNYLVGIPGPQRLDPQGFASGLWVGHYQNQRNALQLIDVANATALSTTQKSAVSGFGKTFRALELLYVIVSRDTLGAPVDIPADPNSPAAFVSRDSVYKFISATLDGAATDLQAGGAAFSFSLHSGFAGFDTPATFLQFNRAIAARVLAYRGSLGCGATCYNQALTALAGTFVSPVGGATSLADLDRGIYNVYSTAAGDTPNSNSFAQDTYIFAHASIQSDAQSGPSGTDARYTRKVVPLASPVTPPQNLNIPATHRFTIYPTPNSPAPIIRNEELMLIRAEANIFTNNFAAAMQDINNIRTVSGGGLGPVAIATPAAGLTALLYERRYSLLFEGQRWNDHRRFGLLNLLPLDQPGQFVAKVMPIPQAECDARVTKPTGCT